MLTSRSRRSHRLVRGPPERARLGVLWAAVLVLAACKSAGDPVPWPSTSTLELGASSVEVGGPGVTVTVTVRNKGGGALRDVIVTLASTGSANQWSPEARLRTGRDGKGTATLSSTTAEVKTVFATVGGSRLSAAPQVAFTAGALSPAASELEVTPATVAANGRSAVAVTATLRDAFGNPLAGTPVDFSATGDGNAWSSSSVVTGGDGRATAQLSSTVAEVKQVVASVGGVAVGTARPVRFLIAFDDLLITEVSSAAWVEVPAWVELYNQTTAPIDLAAYTLRSSAALPGGALVETSFTLPHVTVPVGGFAVLAGKTWSGQVDGGGLVHLVGADGSVPFWRDSGHVELSKAGQTVDFVRFGADAVAPATAGSWTGGAAPALPAFSTDPRIALARRAEIADSDGPGDWYVVPFATPGGVNDVAPDAVDSDEDGVPDAAKLPGGSFAGLDLYAMGARPGQRDLFIELDAMDSTDAGVVPRREAIAQVVARFASQGIVVHVDAGRAFSAVFDPAAFNLGQAVAKVPSAVCVGFDTPGCATIEAYEASYLELGRRAIFHYALFATSQRVDGSAGNSGVATLPGTELLVTLGGWGLDISTPRRANLVTNYQAAVLMHELGHNLGLGHGGFEDTNYKPNYLSVMNYLYALSGVPDPASPAAGVPYLVEWYHQGSILDLEHGPTANPDTFALDYSHGGGQPLDESAVLEVGGLGRGGAWVDFDDDAVEDAAAYALDLTRDNAYGILMDQDDWSAIVLPFGDAAALWYRLDAPPSGSMPVARPELRATPFAGHLRRHVVETTAELEAWRALRRDLLQR
jgi:hypothetical protein